MFKLNRISGLIVGLFLLTSINNPLASFEWPRLSEYECCFDWASYLEISGGYREDCIKTTIHASDPETDLCLEDTLKATGVKIWEIGGKGRYEFCSNWFIKGFAFGGKATEGKYREKTFVDEFFFPLTSTESHVRKGLTYDFSIGIGYLFPIFTFFKMGPQAGWAWNGQQFTIGKAVTNGEFDFVLTDLSYHNRWQGPWIGTEALFSYCGVNYALNYEFHLPNWNGDWFLHGDDVQPGAFSDNRHSRRGFGNVIELQSDYFLCNYLVVGLDFKYQYWHIKEGRETPKTGDFDTVGLNNSEEDKTAKSSWESYGVQVNVGFFF